MKCYISKARFWVSGREAIYISLVFLMRKQWNFWSLEWTSKKERYYSDFKCSIYKFLTYLKTFFIFVVTFLWIFFILCLVFNHNFLAWFLSVKKWNRYYFKIVGYFACNFIVDLLILFCEIKLFVPTRSLIQSFINSRIR